MAFVAGLAAFLFAMPAPAQTYPPLSGRVVDQANILSPEQEAALTAKLEAVQAASTRQLVVLTVPDLQGREIEEYGVGLGRAWRIGQSEANNGVILIVAIEERKVRIEVGYGLEGILTDALSSQIIRNEITPRFREGDYPGGINAGVDAIIAQLQAPPEAAEARAKAASDAHRSRRGSGSILTLIFWVVILAFIIIFSILRRGVRGRRFGGKRGRRSPVILWGPGLGGGGWGGSSWGGGGGGSSWGGGGGGGFSGGGGSFGGGGASGGW
jgi:uncharacterized protein